MNFTVGFFTGLASLMGLGGAADKVNLPNAYNYTSQEVREVVQYHNLNISQQDIKNIVEKIFNSSLDENIEIKTLKKIIEQKIKKLVFECEPDLLSLPNALNQTHKIYYFKANRQADDWSCGFWSIFNAKAIDVILNNNISTNIKLSSNNINKLSKELRSKINRKAYLSAEEIYAIAQSCNLNNRTQDELDRYNIGENKLHVLEMHLVNENLSENLNENISEVYPSHIYDLQEKISFFRNLKRSFTSSNRANALYFVCHLERARHWILVSVVKLENRQPIIIVHDSAHFSISKNSADYIRFLYNNFLE